MSETFPPEYPTAMELPPAPRRRRWLSLVLAVVVFASGFAAGAGTSVVVIHNRLLRAIRHPELGPERITNRLRRSLELSDAQATKVEAILRQRQVALQDIRRRVQPEVEAQIDLVEKEVDDVLRPEQKQKWHEMLKQLRATWLPPAPPAAKSDPRSGDR